MSNRVTVSPRLARYIALPGGATVVLRAGGSPGLETRGTGFEVRTQFGALPALRGGRREFKGQMPGNESECETRQNYDQN